MKLANGKAAPAASAAISGDAAPEAMGGMKDWKGAGMNCLYGNGGGMKLLNGNGGGLNVKGKASSVIFGSESSGAPDASGTGINGGRKASKGLGMMDLHHVGSDILKVGGGFREEGEGRTVRLKG